MIKIEVKQSGYGMAGVYKEIAEIAGDEIAKLMHENFKGQQVVFPNKLYSSKFIAKKISILVICQEVFEKDFDMF